MKGERVTKQLECIIIDGRHTRDDVRERAYREENEDGYER